MTHHHLWSLIMQSDAISMAVLIGLLGLSIACWTVVIAKKWAYRSYKKQASILYNMLLNIRTIDQLLAAEAVIEPEGAGKLWHAACQAARAQTIEKSFDISRIHLEPIMVSLEDSYQKIVQELGSSLSVLSTSAEIAPLLGLFGTVWGLIHSFVRISMLQSADIVTVAPGIAEALITTLAGLVVAVPAVAAYHHLKQTENSLLRITDQIADRTELIFTQCIRKGSYVNQPHTTQTADVSTDTTARHTHPSY